MEVTVGRRLQLLEKATRTNGPFWTKELGLGRDLWRQWRSGRSPNAVLKRQADIVHVLDTIGYRVAPDILSASIAEEAGFTAKLEPRQQAEMASYFDMDLSAMPSVGGDRFSEGLRQLRSFGRAERSAKVGMLIGLNPTAVRAVLSTWLLDPSLQPTMPVIHLDARKYADASTLLARIVDLIEPSRLLDLGSPSEQVAFVAAAARDRRFLLIIEHLDRYGDSDLVIKADEFRIGMPHFLIANIIYSGFLFTGQATAARLLMTARLPLHSLPHGPFPIMRVPGSMLSITDESRLHRLDGTDASTADATVRRLAELFPNDAGVGLAASRTDIRSAGHLAPELDATEREARELISSLPPPEKLFLRLLAASVDGLRRDTMERLLEANGAQFRALIASGEDLDSLQNRCSPLVWECEDMTTRGRGRSVQIVAEDLRRYLIAEWEEAEIDLARKVYRQIGIIAFEVADATKREGARQAVAERFIQAARCLLASLDPRRGDRGSTRRTASGPDWTKTREVVRWLESCDGVGHAADINDFVFRDIWQRVLEDGQNYRLVRSHGLIEAKILLLQSFLQQGTLLPLDLSDAVSQQPNSIGYLTNTQHIKILIGIAIAASRAGRNDTTLLVARKAKEMVSRVSGRRQREVYKVLSDALLRAGEIKEAMRVLSEAFASLAGTAACVSQPAKDLPTEEAKFPYVCAIDFRCRQGEAHTIADDLPNARRCFEDARDFSVTLASWGDLHATRANHFEGANGRRYIRFLTAMACRHPTSRLVHLGDAQRHMEHCRTVAEANGWEHDIASLAIDRAKLSRLGSANSHFRPDDLLNQVKRAEELTHRFGVSGIATLEALAERARAHSFIAGLGVDPERHLMDGRGAARHLLDSARASKLPIFEAEALLLLGELQEPQFEEHLNAHDRLCEEHSIRIFERARALIVHGVNAAHLGAW